MSYEGHMLIIMELEGVARPGRRLSAKVQMDKKKISAGLLFDARHAFSVRNGEQIELRVSCCYLLH